MLRNENSFSRHHSSMLNDARITAGLNTVGTIIHCNSSEINRVKVCPYGCKGGLYFYVDGDGFDCPIPCPNCN